MLTEEYPALPSRARVRDLMDPLLLTGLLLVGVLALSFANGANDNFKGVATLYGAGRLTYRQALTWASATTFCGSLVALLVGHKLLVAFSGKGLVPDSLLGDSRFLLAVATGAAGTVLVATRLGFPISTTHSLVGGLVGAGLAMPGGSVTLSALGQSFLLPLLLSPIVALFLTVGVVRAGRWLRVRAGLEPASCVCVEAVESPPQASISGAVMQQAVATLPTVRVHREGCPVRDPGSPRLTARTALDAGHILSAGMVCFARALNDTPKIMTILVATSALDRRLALILVGVTMTLGGILMARRVSHTLSHEITPMNDGEGFAGNAVTAALVLVASRLGMPVSTTHVSVGALFGIGYSRGESRRRAVRAIVLSWVATLPIALLLAAGTAYLLTR